MPRGQTPPEAVGSTADAQQPADSEQQPSAESMPLDAWNAFVKAQADDGAKDAAFGETEATAQTASAQPGGAGGWMDAKKEEGKAAPEACALAPIFVSALVEPPSSGTVTSLYGWREHPISGADDFHRGLDIAAPEGVGVYAALPGRVAEVDTSPFTAITSRSTTAGGFKQPIATAQRLSRLPARICAAASCLHMSAARAFHRATCPF